MSILLGIKGEFGMNIKKIMLLFWGVGFCLISPIKVSGDDLGEELLRNGLLGAVAGAVVGGVTGGNPGGGALVGAGIGAGVTAVSAASYSDTSRQCWDEYEIDEWEEKTTYYENYRPRRSRRYRYPRRHYVVKQTEYSLPSSSSRYKKHSYQQGYQEGYQEGFTDGYNEALKNFRKRSRL